MYYFIIVLLTFSIQAKNIASFKKKGSKTVQNITLQEVQSAYQVVLQNSLNIPSPKKFIDEYIRYRIAVKEAYNDRSIVKSAEIRSMIVDSGLKEGFDQLMYKTLAEKKMQSRLVKIDREARTLSDKQLRAFYRKNPYYNLQYIVISLPESASAVQVRNVKKRSMKIYSTVSKSKKPFNQLISLYSDNPSAGIGAIYHSRSTLYPLLYQALQSLKPGQISQPVQTPNGFYILKLNQVVAFNQADKTDIKQQYFSQKRSEVLNHYFNQVQSMYDISINKQVLRSL